MYNMTKMKMEKGNATIFEHDTVEYAMRCCLSPKKTRLLDIVREEQRDYCNTDNMSLWDFNYKTAFYADSDSGEAF